MSLDNALRAGLVREGEAITVDVGAALPAIRGRVRTHRRRRALQGLVVALVVALVVWAPPGLRIETMDERPRPAREPFPQEKLLDRRGGQADGRVVRVEAGGTRARGPHATGFEPMSHERARAARPVDQNGAGARPPSPETAVGVLARRVFENYEVAYVQGTHISENAGTGCTRGGEAMGTNDCFPIRLGDDETEVSFRLVDDKGILVGATVRQHAGEDASELVSFCGSTDGYIAVQPGALLLVYIDASDRCSKGRPRTGTLTAFIR